jgi:hypothetical protein
MDMDIVFNPLKEREREKKLEKQTSYSLVHKR